VAAFIWNLQSEILGNKLLFNAYLHHQDVFVHRPWDKKEDVSTGTRQWDSKILVLIYFQYSGKPPVLASGVSFEVILGVVPNLFFEPRADFGSAFAEAGERP